MESVIRSMANLSLRTPSKKKIAAGSRSAGYDLDGYQSSRYEWYRGLQGIQTPNIHP